MDSVQRFIYDQSVSQRAMFLFFHKLLTEEYCLEAKIRYKIPFYYRKSWICYLNPKKSKSVEFVFLRGNELSNSHKILSSNARKQVMGIEILELSDIPIVALQETILEALLLDETIPYKSNWKKR